MDASDAVENVLMTFDPENVKLVLHKLRDLFDHAHDLRTSMNGSKYSAYDDLGEKVEEIIEMMDKNSWSAKSVLNSAADFSNSIRPEEELKLINSMPSEAIDGIIEFKLKDLGL